MMVFNTGMTAAKMFGTPGGTRLSPRLATPLFPFASPVSVYGGACSNNLPSGAGSAPAVPSVTVTPGGTSNVTVQLPALNLTVRNGTSSSPGTVVNNARVVTYDLECEINGNPIEREFRTNTSGQLNTSNRGLPWGTYGRSASTRRRSPPTRGSRTR